MLWQRFESLSNKKGDVKEDSLPGEDRNEKVLMTVSATSTTSEDKYGAIMETAANSSVPQHPQATNMAIDHEVQYQKELPVQDLPEALPIEVTNELFENVKKMHVEDSEFLLISYSCRQNLPRDTRGHQVGSFYSYPT